MPLTGGSSYSRLRRLALARGQFSYRVGVEEHQTNEKHLLVERVGALLRAAYGIGKQANKALESAATAFLRCSRRSLNHPIQSCTTAKQRIVEADKANFRLSLARFHDSQCLVMFVQYLKRGCHKHAMHKDRSCNDEAERAPQTVL